MGRGKGKTIKGSDLKNMSPNEIRGVNQIIANRGLTPNVRIEGAAVVRNSGGDVVRYGVGATPGKYNEDKL